jgi:ribonuclease HI
MAITWVKGHAGIPSNERADVLAGNAAEKAGSGIPTASLAYLRLKRQRDLARQSRSSRDRRDLSTSTEGVLS